MKIIKYKEKERKMNKKREILGACWKVVVEMKKIKDKFERKIRREIKKMKYEKMERYF